jgi:ubiquinone/menaquinone biosynthesis C-methylase UbiE
MKQNQFWAGVKNRRSPSHPSVVAFTKPKIDFIRENTGEVKRILDAGCGNGRFTRPLSEWASCVAMDSSINMLNMNQEGAPKVWADATDIPFPDNYFDMAFCANLLHHIQEPIKAVSEMRRVSSRYVVMIEPNRNNPLMFAFLLIRPEERGGLKFSMGYMKRLIKQAGLKSICSKTMGSIVPNKTPLKLLPFLKLIDGGYPMGFYNVVVCEK